MKNFITELIATLSGGISAAAYTAALMLALIGFIAMAIINYQQRTEKETAFNWSFWFRKNGSHLLLLVICVYTLLRFYEDLIVTITENTGDNFSFIKDKYLWFLVGGFIFRVIVHQGQRLIRKLTG